MPTQTIPLIVPFTHRAFSTNINVDQLIKGAFCSIGKGSISNEAIPFLEKRPGLALSSTPAAGSKGNFVFFPSSGVVVSGFGASFTTVYSGTTSCGTISGGFTAIIYHATEAIISGVVHVLMLDSNSVGWYLPLDAVSSFTFTGDTHTNTTIDNISSMTGLYVGQLISGTGITAGTRIATVNTSGSSITTTIATTATNAGITITREGIAQILDANFPSTATGAFAEIDGFICIMDRSGNVRNSELNDITSWPVANTLPTNIVADLGRSVFRYKGYLIAFGSNSIDFLINAGSAYGSPLLIEKGSSIKGIGLYASGVGLSVAQIADAVYFISQSDVSFYVLRGNQPQKLSYGTIALGVESNPLRVSSLVINDINFILITAGQSGTDESYLFDVETGVFTLAAFSIIPAASSNGTSCAFVNTIGTDGEVYSITKTPTVFQDDGAAYSLIYQSQPYYLNDGKPFIIDWVDLIADTQSSGSTTLDKSVDDYATTETLGTFDLTSSVKRIQPGGYCDSHVIFKLTDSGNNAWRGQALKVHWTPCN